MKTCEILVRKVPAELRTALKVRCAQEGVSMQDKIIELIRAFLEEFGDLLKPKDRQEHINNLLEGGCCNAGLGSNPKKGKG